MVFVYCFGNRGMACFTDAERACLSLMRDGFVKRNDIHNTASTANDGPNPSAAQRTVS